MQCITLQQHLLTGTRRRQGVLCFIGFTVFLVRSVVIWKSGSGLEHSATSCLNELLLVTPILPKQQQTASNRHANSPRSAHTHTHSMAQCSPVTYHVLSHPHANISVTHLSSSLPSYAGQKTKVIWNDLTLYWCNHFFMQGRWSVDGPSVCKLEI